MTYADLFASQPFRNQLVTMTLTGKQIKDMLEQQWLDPKRPRILQVSKGFSLRVGRIEGRRRAHHRRADVAERAADRSRRELSRHREQFSVRRRRRLHRAHRGTAPLIGIYDVDALYAYFGANSPVGPTAADRIVRIN